VHRLYPHPAWLYWLRKYGLRRRQQLSVPANLKANVLRGASPLLERLLLPSRGDFGQADLFVPIYVALDHVDPLPCHLL
jgi:hypothetical protein